LKIARAEHVDQLVALAAAPSGRLVLDSVPPHPDFFNEETFSLRGSLVHCKSMNPLQLWAWFLSSLLSILSLPVT